MNRHADVVADVTLQVRFVREVTDGHGVRVRELAALERTECPLIGVRERAVDQLPLAHDAVPEERPRRLRIADAHADVGAMVRRLPR